MEPVGKLEDPWVAELFLVGAGGFDGGRRNPMVVDGMIGPVFFGDNGSDDEDIGSINGLELLMIKAAAMERQALHAQLQGSRAACRAWAEKSTGRTWNDRGFESCNLEMFSETVGGLRAQGPREGGAR